MPESSQTDKRDDTANDHMRGLPSIKKISRHCVSHPMLSIVRIPDARRPPNAARKAHDVRRSSRVGLREGGTSCQWGANKVESESERCIEVAQSQRPQEKRSRTNAAYRVRPSCTIGPSSRRYLRGCLRQRSAKSYRQTREKRTRQHSCFSRTAELEHQQTSSSHGHHQSLRRTQARTAQPRTIQSS